jgi:hypothetical protein
MSDKEIPHQPPVNEFKSAIKPSPGMIKGIEVRGIRALRIHRQ